MTIDVLKAKLSYTIDVESSFLTKKDIKKIEEKYHAKYICESCTGVRTTDNGNTVWSDIPSAIFYTDTPHPKGSHWFAITYIHPQTFISNAISVVGIKIFGIVAKDNTIIYSRYRHDYRYSSDGSVWIDGGRDYTRHSGGQIVALKIEKDKLIIDPEQ